METKPDRSDKTIEFKALTDGLGFHPFSNGLPYAPVTPKPASKPNFESGTGAYSAGRPSFVMPQKAQAPAQPSTSVQRPAAHVQIPIQKVQPQFQNQTHHQVHARAQAQVQTQSKAQPLLQVHAHYGFEYIARRFLAYFVDSFLNMTLGAGTLFLVLWKQVNNLDSLLNPSILVVSAIFLMFFNWALITAQEVAFHTSVGKKFFGLQLNGSLGAILMRAILFVPSCAVFGLGVLWILFSGDGRAWHDSASGVQPQEVAEL